MDSSLSTTELKLKLQLYKVHFLLLIRNLKHAKREVKLAMNIARGRDLTTTLLLKSQLEYACGNHQKAIKLLMASSSRMNMAVLNMFNNLGCIYYQLGKYHTSSILFSKALSSCSSLRKDKPLKLLTLSQDKSLLVFYNCGVQHLACGKPLLAARCFQKASLIFYNSPVLWLRLAECCIMALEKGLVRAGYDSSSTSEIVVHVVGKGKWRHLALDKGISRNGYVDSAEKEFLCLGEDQPKLSMSFSRQCLLNALHLLDYSELNHLKYGLPSAFSLNENELGKNPCNKNLTAVHDNKAEAGLCQISPNIVAKEQHKGGTSQEIMQNSISYYEVVHRRENQMIKQALLANLAYVELELENLDNALSTAMSLLELHECSKIFAVLGHLYAAESPCLLNKPKEAAEHLSVYLSVGNNLEFPFKQEDFEQLQVQKSLDSFEELNGASTQKKYSSTELKAVAFLRPDEARGTLYANFAAIYAMRVELDRAYNFVTQALALMPENAEVTLTAVYLDLLMGKSEFACYEVKTMSQDKVSSRQCTIE
ncbi:CCR4-NOT transcription complex subunit 10 [Linum perenne]